MLIILSQKFTMCQNRTSWYIFNLKIKILTLNVQHNSLHKHTFFINIIIKEQMEFVNSKLHIRHTTTCRLDYAIIFPNDWKDIFNVVNLL